MKTLDEAQKQVFNISTPKTLDEALFRVLNFPCNEIQELGYAVLRDFIAQKFGAAYLRMGMWRDGSSTAYTPEDIIKRLFEELTDREAK